jgi:hypothetical protein
MTSGTGLQAMDLPGKPGHLGALQKQQDSAPSPRKRHAMANTTPDLLGVVASSAQKPSDDALTVEPLLGTDGSATHWMGMSAVCCTWCKMVAGDRD